MDSDMSASRNGEDIDMDDLNGPQKDEELTLEDTDTLLTELFKEYSDVDNRRMQLNGRIQGLFAHRRALQGDDATDVKSCEVPGLVTKIKKPRPKKDKADKRKRLVCCIHCYMHDLPCDRGYVCMPCAKARRPCKRAKCEHFAAGICNRRNCHRAHEGDDYPIIVHAGPVFKASTKAKNSGRKRGQGQKQQQEDGQQTPTHEGDETQKHTEGSLELAVRPKCKRVEDDDRDDDGMKRSRADQS